MRWAALFALVALLGCGDNTPIEEDLAISITIEEHDVTLGMAFPLTVVRTWNEELTPEPWDDGALSPLLLRSVSMSRRESNGRVEERREFEAYAFSLGDVSVMPASFVARSEGGEERSSRCDPIALTVQRAFTDREPGGAELPDDSLGNRLPWGVILGVGFALAACVGMLVRARRRRPMPELVVEAVDDQPEAPTPDAIALGRLRRGTDLPCHEEVAEIVRTYVGARFDLRTAESTTEETLQALCGRTDQQGALLDVLSTCDLVKFAGRVPTEGDRAQLVEDASAFVRATSPSGAP